MKTGKVNDNVKTQIIKASKAIRKKQLALKLGRVEGDVSRRRYFEAITEPLKKLIDVTKVKEEVLPETVLSTIKDEIPKAMSAFIKQKSPSAKKEQQMAAQIRTEPQSPPAHEYDPFTEEEHIGMTTEQSMDEFRQSYQSMLDKNSDIVDTYLEQYALLPRIYLDGLLADTKGEYDTTTGVRYEPSTEKLMLGRSVLEIDGEDIVIEGIRYKGTPGLYELIFKSEPRGYKAADYDRYRDILNRTCVHRRNYDPKQQVRGSKSIKHTTIIGPIMRFRSASAREPLGHGLNGVPMIASDAPCQYIYWDDVNELVDRLRLLFASSRAGHNNHNNEIASLIEELREAGVVE